MALHARYNGGYSKALHWVQESSGMARWMVPDLARFMIWFSEPKPQY